jgi:chromate reductase
MGTPAAVIGASTGMFGAVWAQAEARKVLGALGGRVLEREFPFPCAQDAYADGELRLAPEQSSALEEILRELIASAEEAAEARAEAQAAAAT